MTHQKYTVSVFIDTPSVYINMDDAVSQRIKILREHLGLTRKELAQRLEVGSTAISNLELGQSLPSFQLLFRLSSTTGVSGHWLLTGGGEMFPGQAASTGTELLEGIPVVDQRAAAGLLAGYADASPNAPRIVLPDMQGRERMAAIPVRGDSMEPTLRDGDFVVASPVPLQDVQDNQVYVVDIRDEGVVVKRVLNRLTSLSALVLKSDNKSYPNRRVEAEDVVAVWRVRRRITWDLSGPDGFADRLIELEKRQDELEAIVREALS